MGEGRFISGQPEILMLDYRYNPPGFRDAASAAQGLEGVPAHTAQAPCTSLGLPHLLLQMLRRKRLALSEGQLQQTQGERGGGEEVRFYCCAAR